MALNDAAKGLHVLTLPAPSPAALSLVLLHGLGFSGAVWQELADDLKSSFRLHIFDLPGFGQSAPPPPGKPLETLLAGVLAQLPPRACLLGWSLGGHLALELAMRFPKRVSGLVTIGTNPCFQQRQGWRAGVPREDLSKFREIIAGGQEEGIRRLAALIARGEEEPLSVAHRCERLAASAPPSAEGIEAGLRVLAEADMREGLQALPIPVLHILGGGDALVPVALAPALGHLCPAHRVMVLPRAGHAPFLTFPAAVAAAVRCFAEDSGLLPPPPQPLDRRRVARSFSRAASDYDGAALLQRESGETLLAHVLAHSGSAADAGRGPRRLLDLGCGTGYFLPKLREAFPQGQHLALDLATGMLHRARSHAAADAWLAADAAQLPLAAGTLDLIFANLVFQWCAAPGQLLEEMARVLRPGGRIAFATFGPETLWELRTAWRAADGASHVRRFPPVAEWRQAAIAAGLHGAMLKTQVCMRRYPSLQALASELKSLGARNIAPKGSGLTPPKQLAKAQAVYETLRDEAGLPATFQLIFGLLEKR